MIYIAHRGAPLYRAENTVPSFKLAADAGMDWFELDVLLSKDGQLVVHHDYDFSRSAGLAAEVGEMNFAQIRELDIRRLCAKETEPCRVPLLSEVFAIIPAAATVNIEIKNEDGRYPGIEQVVADFAAKNGPERIVVSNFTHDSLRIIKRIAPDLRLGVLSECGCAEQAIGTALELGAESLNVGLRGLTASMVDKAHSAGLSVLVWTVADLPQLEFAAAAGVDGVFINDPYLKL